MGKTAHEIKKHLHLEKTFNASKNQLFQAWVNPESLAQWWGPHDFTNPVCEIDARKEGKINVLMRDPDGKIFPMTGVFHEVNEPDKLVFTTTAYDENDNKLFDVLNTVQFDQQNGNTLLTLDVKVMSTFEGAEKFLEGMEEGWNQTLDRLNVFMIRF